ncbi:MAG: TonB-dependent receptor domain-containing protein, partial [Verrucomicrobiota bacterium]
MTISRIIIRELRPRNWAFSTLLRCSAWVLLAAWCQGLASPAAFAQEGVGAIRGVVYDKDFDAPLPNAQIAVMERDQKITSTDEGNYVLSDIPPGNYTLVVSKQGFTRKVKSEVMVRAGQMTEVDVWLSGDFTDMQEFVVQDFVLGGSTEIGLLNLRMEMPAMLDSIGAELISKAGAGDAASALRLVAGATVQDGKYAVVRGLPDRYVNSQMNGVRLPTADPDKRAVQLDQFPSALIDNIQVSKTFTPDQQGDASGGAVNVVLKSIPNEPVLDFKLGAGHNFQTSGSDTFLSYKGGGVNYSGKDDGGRKLPFSVKDAFDNKEPAIRDDYVDFFGNPQDGDPPPTADDLARYEQREDHANSFSPVMGVSQKNVPFDHNWQVTAGNSWDVNSIKLGALSTFFYKNEFEGYNDGKNMKRLGRPKDDTYGYDGTDTSDRFELYEVDKSQESVLWGGLLSLGAKTENNDLGLIYMHTHSAQDSAMLMNDTLAFNLGLTNEYFRNETLRYSERTATTLQLRGKHVLQTPNFEFGNIIKTLDPEVKWIASDNSSTLLEPDLRSILAMWEPDNRDDPNGNGTWKTVPIGNVDFAGTRMWRDVEEDSRQFQIDGKLPFEQWTGTEGALKSGLFADRVERTYQQDSFKYEHGPGYTPWKEEYSGGFFDSSFSDIFELDKATGYDGIDYDSETMHPLQNEMPWQILRSGEDASYDGKQDIDAWYWMADIPIRENLKMVGGMRLEKTHMSTQFRASDGESLFFFKWDDGKLDGKTVGPDRWSEADASFDRTDVLPALSMEYTPVNDLTLRAAYSKTVARPTFKEISPILQLEYLGSDQFVGNNNLTMSELVNYDLRIEYMPMEESFFSASWFHKDITDPIEYAQVDIAGTPYIQPFNFPDGWLRGMELEARQSMGKLHPLLKGLKLRLNATLIDSEVTVPEIIPGTNRSLAGTKV